MDDLREFHAQEGAERMERMSREVSDFALIQGIMERNPITREESPLQAAA